MRYLTKWLLIIMTSGGFIYWMTKQDSDAKRDVEAKLEPFNAQVERYLTRVSTSSERLSAKGNFIVVDAKTKRLDGVPDYVTRPNGQRHDAGAVDSVVLHNCDYVQVGIYSNGSKALQHVCDFKVIDVASGTWSSWGEFKGSMPPSEIKRRRGSTTDETGGRAIYEFYAAGGVAK